jgi:2-phosphoglycolate phosphatase
MRLDVMISAVAYDLDGTLIDSTDAIVKCFLHACDVLGVAKPAREEVVNTIGHLLEDQFRLLTTADPDEGVRVYRERYRDVCCEMTSLLPGAREALERARAAGLRIGFATSKRRDFAELILAHLGVLEFFEVRLGPDDVRHAKPHPEVVLTALERFGVGPDEMVFVGDMYFDALAARDAGVRCLCVATGYNTREELEALETDGVFDTLRELTDRLLDMAGEDSLV